MRQVQRTFGKRAESWRVRGVVCVCLAIVAVAWTGMDWGRALTVNAAGSSQSLASHAADRQWLGQREIVAARWVAIVAQRHDVLDITRADVIRILRRDVQDWSELGGRTRPIAALLPASPDRRHRQCPRTLDRGTESSRRARRRGGGCGRRVVGRVCIDRPGAPEIRRARADRRRPRSIPRPGPSVLRCAVLVGYRRVPTLPDASGKRFATAQLNRLIPLGC